MADVVGVEREPGDTALAVGDPLAQQGGFAKTGGRRNEREALDVGRGQALGQARALDGAVAWATRRNEQLGGQQRNCHR